MKKRLVLFAIGFFVLDSFMTLNVYSTNKTQKTNIDIKFCQMSTLKESELELIAKCVESEAGNQNDLGKRLVVDVILNRVDSERFPDDVESVISQKYHFTTFGMEKWTK